MTVTSIILAMALAAAPPNQELEDQRSNVQSKLEAERSLLAALRDKRVGILETLEVVEKRARESQAKVKAARAQALVMEKRLEEQVERERVAKESLSRTMEEVGPRLSWVYRFSKRRQLNWILASTDFSSLVKRSRALVTIVDGDLALLQKAVDEETAVEEVHLELERVRASLAAQMQELENDQAAAIRRKNELADLLDALRVDTSHHLHLRSELEREEQKLSRMIERLERVPAGSQFLRLEGTLPMPVQGLVEVTFGQVVNPKFNTVVQQKGLDIRAVIGSPVRAVARGKVVYSGWMRGYGNLAIIDHGDGFHTLMAHLADFVRSPGDNVEPGDVVALVGDTGSLKGAYLYFELRQNGQAINPTPWLESSVRSMARLRNK